MFQDLDRSSLKIFSDIAFRCLKRSREDRPKMAEVVIELDAALKVQQIREGKVQLVDYEEMARAAEPPFNYGSKAELMMHLSKQGILLNDGKTWFSMNPKGEHCEMISIAKCLIPDEIDSSRYSSDYGSRFPVGCYKQQHDFQTRLRTQLLSPLVTYSVNLVFKCTSGGYRKNYYIDLVYKMKSETGTSTSYLASMREDGFYMAELYHFTCESRIVDLEIFFVGYYKSTMLVEGIEFCPLEKVEYQLSELEGEKEPISNSSDAYWEEKLPIDYQGILKWSDKIVEWGTKKELYSTLSKGFLINDGQEWFSLDKNGKKCLMLSAARLISGKDVTSLTSWSLLESRFGEVVIVRSHDFKIRGEIKAEVVSHQTTYASYLVYTLLQEKEELSSSVGPTKVMEKDLHSGNWNWNEDDFRYFYHRYPQTPFIGRNNNVDDDILRSPVVNRPNFNGIALPQQRRDGWMEVQVWEFQTGTTAKTIPMGLKLSRLGFPAMKGLVIQGIEIRPV